MVELLAERMEGEGRKGKETNKWESSKRFEGPGTVMSSKKSRFTEEARLG